MTTKILKVKSIRSLLLLASLCLVLAGCDVSGSRIQGEWVTLNKEDRLDLFEDNTGRIVLGNESYTLSWSVLSDGRLKLDVSGPLAQTSLAEIRGKMLKIDESISGMSEGVRGGTYFVKSDQLESGKWQAWYDSGQKLWEATILNGKLTGSSRHWFENGKVKEEATLEDGKYVGELKKYYETGELRKVAKISKDLKSETVERYYLTGELRGTSTFKDGKFKVANEYYPDGTELSVEKPGDNGEIIFQIWAPDKSVSYTSGVLFEKSKVVKLVSEYSSPNEVNKSQIDGETSYTINYSDGSKFLSVRVDSSTRHFISYESFYPNGASMVDIQYEDGKEQGRFTFKNEKGKAIYYDPD